MIIDRVPNLILKKVLRSGARSELHLVPDITCESQVVRHHVTDVFKAIEVEVGTFSYYLVNCNTLLNSARETKLD